MSVKLKIRFSLKYNFLSPKRVEIMILFEGEEESMAFFFACGSSFSNYPSQLRKFLSFQLKLNLMVLMA
jgi:hypothetical protein